MKGTTPDKWSDGRRKEVFGLLAGLGGRARWSQLEREPRELVKSPTTLKKILDEMEEEGSIRVEARRGPGGPEVWYILSASDDQIWEELQGRPLGSRIVDITERLHAAATEPDLHAALVEVELPSLIALGLWGRLLVLDYVSREVPLEIAGRVHGYLHDAILADEEAALLGLCLTIHERAPDVLRRSMGTVEEALRSVGFPEEA
jgi:DNA-binding HxlR family transcriptional regulator